MNIPEYISYQGKTHQVMGWAGKQYRLGNGTFAPMTECTPVGAKVESVELISQNVKRLEDETPAHVVKEANSIVRRLMAESVQPKKADLLETTNMPPEEVADLIRNQKPVVALKRSAGRPRKVK